MGAYIYSILCASLAVALIYSAAPEGEGLSKFISFAGALAVALTILHPFLSGNGTELDSFFEQSEPAPTDSAARAEYAARNAVLSLSALSGADAEKITAQVSFGDSGDMWVVLICDDNITVGKEKLEERLTEILGYSIEIRDKMDGGA